MSDRETVRKALKSVPSLPSVVVKLQKYLNDPDVGFDHLAKIIQYDPGLTANLLKMANSSYFGSSREIKSVQEAISRLGTKRIFQLVLSMSVTPMVNKPIKGYDMDSGGLWEHSIATAICAEQLAASIGMKNAEDAFTAGLLHDLGKVVLGTFIDVDDEPIKEIVKSDNLSFNEAEKMVLGIDHAEVAGELLENWNLSEEVTACARWHHEPGKADPKHQQLVDLIHVADVLCINVGWGMGSDGLNYKLDESAAKRLGIKIGSAEEVIMQVMLGINDLQETLKTSPEGEPNGVQHSNS
ncbi:MAG: HDOD domain-containing protein [Gemmatimonadales bacterium]|nr:HDOD domain-containing protein [Gemmatimonadales bacterium]